MVFGKTPKWVVLGVLAKNTWFLAKTGGFGRVVFGVPWGCIHVIPTRIIGLNWDPL